MKRIGPKIQDLENQIRENLAETKLMINININAGDLNNPDNPPYIEYKLNPNKKEKKLEKELNELKSAIEILIKNNHTEVDVLYEKNDFLYKALIVKKEGVVINKELKYKARLFSNINKVIENYLVR